MTQGVSLLRLLTRRERLRRRIWHLLKDAKVLTFPLNPWGHVPNFVGAEAAATLLAEQPEFMQAKVVFVSAEPVLRRMRELVLERGKVLAVPLPLKMVRKGFFPFLQITERKAIKAAAKVTKFLRYGQPLSLPIDLAVLSSVVADRQGHRLAPFRQLGDPLWQRLVESGFVSEKTKIATLLHPLQFADDLAKWITDQDVRVHLIVTPEEVLRIGEG